MSLGKRKHKSEHAGAKNGGGHWGPRAEAKRVSKKQRRSIDKVAIQSESKSIQSQRKKPRPSAKATPKVKTIIRPLDPKSESEIMLVAKRMRKTLIDVIDKKRGTALYSWDVLADRVRWHLDSASRNGRIFLSEDSVGNITGQTLARVEIDENNSQFGRFSMIYVDPKFRGHGIGTQIIEAVESWFRSLNMPKIIYNTAETNQRVIDLFHRHGYRITHSESQMVQMTKELA